MLSIILKRFVSNTLAAGPCELPALALSSSRRRTLRGTSAPAADCAAGPHDAVNIAVLSKVLGRGWHSQLDKVFGFGFSRSDVVHVKSNMLAECGKVSERGASADRTCQVFWWNFWVDPLWACRSTYPRKHRLLHVFSSPFLHTEVLLTNGTLARDNKLVDETLSVGPFFS